jgi:hypothetical protein
VKKTTRCCAKFFNLCASFGSQFHYFNGSALNITPPTQKATLHIDPTEVVKYLTLFLFFFNSARCCSKFFILCALFGSQFNYFNGSALNITPPTQKATLHIDPTEVEKYLTLFLFL